VAYKAIGNAWTDLYAGAIQFMFVDLTAGPRQVWPTRRGRWRSRCPSAAPSIPRLPTLGETFPPSPAPASWRSPCPRHVAPIQEKLNALINAAISAPEIRDRLVNEFALDARPLSLEQCAAQDARSAPGATT